MNQKGFAPIILVFVIILLAGVGGVYFLARQPSQTTPPPSPTQTPNQPPDKTANNSDIGNSTSVSTPQSPIVLNLSISHPPALGERAELTILLISSENAPGTEVWVSLPEGFELVSGSLYWKVDLQPKQEQKFTLLVKAVKNGYWTIEASAKHTVSSNPVLRFGDAKLLHLQVGAKFGRIGISSTSQEEYTVKITPPAR